ncbi:PA0069 family radical SAM protein [Ravibacter arvi]|uniref:PA0069 family radical SAM protein n=1 Tax=Ravibacter arvi TaxID=2051041 RepID=A0ABP8M1Y7_9BACT
MSTAPKGRGAGINTPNRFSKLRVEQDEEWADHRDDELSDPVTQFITEYPKSIVSDAESPDLEGFTSVNPYRGCEHGCIYCFARNSHEYWGFSAGLDFETRIIVKMNAPDLLEQAFNSKKWRPRVIHLSGNTDCYQPAEKKFGLTRRLLEVCLRYRNPVAILTKNALVRRDLDILQELAQMNLASVALSVTTLNETTRRALEPRTATGQKRLDTLGELHRAGIPVGVMTAPLIPGLNDHEVPAIIKAASERGACWAGFTIVRLNGAIGGIFTEWVRRHYPDRADKILNQIRACHNGSLNDSRFYQRMRGEGVLAQTIQQMHQLACNRFLAGRTAPQLDTTRFIKGGQLRLF